MDNHPPAAIRPAAFSIPEAAQQLSISRSAIYRLIDRGELRRVKIGSRAVIPASEIVRLLEDRDDDAR